MGGSRAPRHMSDNTQFLSRLRWLAMEPPGLSLAQACGLRALSGISGPRRPAPPRCPGPQGRSRRAGGPADLPGPRRRSSVSVAPPRAEAEAEATPSLRRGHDMATPPPSIRPVGDDGKRRRDDGMQGRRAPRRDGRRFEYYAGERVAGVAGVACAARCHPRQRRGRGCRTVVALPSHSLLSSPPAVL